MDMQTQVPVVILVHGSWMGPWSLAPLVECLEVSGIPCRCPALSGIDGSYDEQAAATGLRTHVDQIVHEIDSRADEHIIMVGHSYGTLVTSEAAAERPDRINDIIFIDGIFPEAGKSVLDSLPDLRERILDMVDPDHGAFLRPPSAAYLGLESPLADEICPRLRPMPLRTHSDPVRHSARRLKGRRYYLGFDETLLGQSIAREARDAGWDATMLPGGHMDILTDPQPVALVIERAFRAAQTA